MVWSAASGERSEVRGRFDHHEAALKDLAEEGPAFTLLALNFSRARARRSRATRSAKTRPARAGWAAFASFFFEQFFFEIFRFGANDGARALGADAGFDGVVGGVGRAQRGTGSTSIPPRSKQH